MRVSEAKTFLVPQTVDQAAIDGVLLSDLEKRMMHFTESPDESESAIEDPYALNEEFVAEYDTNEYEAKISRLLKHAYARLKKKNPTKFRCGTKQ